MAAISSWLQRVASEVVILFVDVAAKGSRDTGSCNAREINQTMGTKPNGWAEPHLTHFDGLSNWSINYLLRILLNSYQDGMMSNCLFLLCLF